MAGAQRVTTVSPWVVGGSGQVRDLFPMPPWLFVSYRAFIGVFVYWRYTVPLLFAFYMWVWRDFWWLWSLLMALGILFLGWALLLAWRMRECGIVSLGHIWATAWRIFKLKRNWHFACFQASLESRMSRGRAVPKIDRIKVTPSGLRARVYNGTVGVTRRNMQNESDTLASCFGAFDIGIRPWLGRTPLRHSESSEIEVYWVDPIRPVRAPVLNVQFGDVDMIPFGYDVSRERIGVSPTLSCMIVGETGSGKSSLVWALIKGLRESGINHRFHVIDPGGGVEMALLEDYEFTDDYVDSGRDAEALIMRMHKKMVAREKEIKASGRRRVNFRNGDELNILIIDELLSLGPILKKGFDSPLGEILTKGRKFGFIVWGCSQLSQKDVIGDVRDLFPQRICLAVPSADLTDAVLGAGAESDGARCSQIPTDTPGVGYMFKNGVRGFIKFRSMYLDDAAIAKLVGVVEAPQTMPMPDSEFKPQVEW